MLSPVDRGIPSPESTCTETDTNVVIAIKARRRSITITFNKLGQPAGGHILIEGPQGKIDRELATKIDLTDAKSNGGLTQ